MITICKAKNTINGKFPLVCGVFSDEKELSIELDINLLKDIDLSLGKVSKIYTLGMMENEVVYLVGLGLRKDYNLNKIQRALVNVNYQLSHELIVMFDSFVGDNDYHKVASRMVEGFCFYNYLYDELKNTKKDNSLELHFVTKLDINQDITTAYNLGIAVNNCRDLTNKPYNYLSAIDLANYAVDLKESLDDNRVSVEIMDKKAIEELKMGAFLAVNKGSVCEPRLIHLKYQGNPETKENVYLVGKGIMYDTGGYSLKTSMNTMKCDMAGAASVIGVFEAVVKNNLNINLGVVICATDNRINGEALLPDDVITAMNGKTIEILSTDAEGRLTLADAVSFAQKYSKEVIDIATLTGGVVVALGNMTTGAFTNDDEMLRKFVEASKEAVEEVWQLPMNEHTISSVKASKVADVKNSIGRTASSAGAAAFIQEFIEEGTKWIHLDIAGTAFHTEPLYGEAYGATGAMVKSMYNYLLRK